MRIACIIATSFALLVAACSQDMDKAKKKAKDGDKEEAAAGGAADAGADAGAVDAAAAADAGVADAGTDPAAADAGGAADATIPEIGGEDEGEADADGGGEAEVFDGKDLDVEIRTLKDKKTKFFVSKDGGDFFDVKKVPKGICNDGSETELAFKAESSKVDEAVLGDSDLLKATKAFFSTDTLDVLFESDGTVGFLDSVNDEKVTLTCPDGLTLEGM